MNRSSQAQQQQQQQQQQHQQHQQYQQANNGLQKVSQQQISHQPIPQHQQRMNRLPQSSLQATLTQTLPTNNPLIPPGSVASSASSSSSSSRLQRQQQHHQHHLQNPNINVTNNNTTNKNTNPYFNHNISSSGALSSHNMPTIPQPALMASNSILTLGPFKHRKDLTRESVFSTYQIIGYIAAGTYGKVYKAKLRAGNNSNSSSNNNNNNSSSNNSNSNIDAGGVGGVGIVGSSNGGMKKDVADGGSEKLKNADGDLQSQNHGSTTNGKSNLNRELKVDLASVGNARSNKRLVHTNEEPLPQFYAIKKFKSDNHHGGATNNINVNTKNKSNHDINGNEALHYTGISQSAIREMSLCRELHNKNITRLINIILENKSIYMIFEFCEHDLLQIIHYHSHPDVKPIPISTVKSLTWQILNGVTYLHKNWIFHRDLKPANIMVTSDGCVKIGDLGLARKFNNPLQSFYTGDKVVVTIWYRAPELLLGTRHYTPAIDLWAVGCILAELLSLRPIFKGEEAKIDINNKKSVPFQKNQFQKIVEILGTPNSKTWPSISKYPEYSSFTQQIANNGYFSSNLSQWYKMIGGENKQCLELLHGLLKYDPQSRLTADQALVHDFFLESPKVHENAFEELSFKYPNRKIYTDDNDMNQLGQAIGGGGNGVNGGGIGATSNSHASKRNGYNDDGSNTKRKRL
ncbi:cyclin-dependent protein kinase [Lodderomyces elongisporus]|uniref:cyclin-dependent protein kinase n=1 Tax=Lodderomyces elongisporus TaxID=36914 RepID=UPI002925E8E5|nr:cyclin-dependent protein kinase [Lodderomyces elongisporus]WLF77289.1 cyclin-dependent protein kinase [Lodderomyces elongisporus]